LRIANENNVANEDDPHKKDEFHNEQNEDLTNTKIGKPNNKDETIILSYNSAHLNQFSGEEWLDRDNVLSTQQQTKREDERQRSIAEKKKKYPQSNKMRKVRIRHQNG